MAPVVGTSVVVVALAGTTFLPCTVLEVVIVLLPILLLSPPAGHILTCSSRCDKEALDPPAANRYSANSWTSSALRALEATRSSSQNDRGGQMMTRWQRLWVRRRLVFSLTLCLVVAAFAVVTLRASPAPVPMTVTVPTPSAPTHAFHLFLLTAPSGDLHLGQTVLVNWMPELLDAASPTQSASVASRLALYGPYASPVALESALHLKGLGNANPSQWPAPAFVSPFLTVSDQTSVSQKVEVLLPATLHPGFYVLAGTSVRRAWDQTTDQTFNVVHVVA